MGEGQGKMRRMSIENLEAAEESFVLYCKHRNLSTVSSIMDIALSTLSRWKNDYKWEERLSRVISKVQERTDTAVSERTAELISGIDRSLDVAFGEFADAETGTKLEMSRAISELVRTRNLLSGEATSRTESKSVETSLDLNSLYDLMSASVPRERVIDVEGEPQGVVTIEDEEGLRRIEETLSGQGIVLLEEGPEIEW